MATRTRFNTTNWTESDRRYGYRFGCNGTVSISEAARMLGVCRDTVYSRIEDDVLRRGEKMGRPCICVESIRRFMEPIEA